MDIKQKQERFDKVICDVIDKCKSENGIVNSVIRDDVFKILEQHCVVVYYPLEHEDINGFHITRTVCETSTHFVYINTWNTTARQIFTAAHELGHIWNVYAKVKIQFPEIDDFVFELNEKSPEEYVVNKFAAQLLMPKDIFIQAIASNLQRLNYNGKSISKQNLLRLIASLMDTFFVGYKATTKRLFEIGRLTETVYTIVKDYEYEDGFKDVFESIIKEGGYQRLNERVPNKNISNLTEIIRKAEALNCELTSTIETLKEEFDISTTELSNQEIDF